jgi:hypothetical protein
MTRYVHTLLLSFILTREGMRNCGRRCWSKKTRYVGEKDARPVSALLVSEVLRRDINLYDREPDFANTSTQIVAGAFPPYIVFKMQYSLQLTEFFPSLKELDRTLFSTCFHPFQRGFFTKFEQELDLLILNKLYPDVPADAEETEEAAEVGKIMQEENKYPAEANAGIRQEMGEPTGVDAGIPEEIDADPDLEAGIQPGLINVTVGGSVVRVRAI